MKAPLFLIEPLPGANEARGMLLEPVGIVLESAQAGDDSLGRFVEDLDGQVHVGAAVEDDPRIAAIAVVAPPVSSGFVPPTSTARRNPCFWSVEAIRLRTVTCSLRRETRE